MFNFRCDGDMRCGPICIWWCWYLQELRRWHVLRYRRKFLRELPRWSISNRHGLNDVCDLPGRFSMLGFRFAKLVHRGPVLGYWSRLLQRLRYWPIFRS